MYETNFGFTDRPFTVSPSPACYFEAAEHQHVLEELLVTISSLNGITILTGDAGTGKTAVCRQLVARLEDQFQIQFVEHCNFPTVRALLQTLLYNLTDCYEKVSEQELRLALTAEVRSSFLNHGQPLLVLVDEAHLLSVSFLEELRVLSDIAFDGKPALQLLLCGQTSLEETLIQPALSSLNQRIGCQVYLDRMTRQESEAYIAYRIQRVSTDKRSCFTDEAIKFITHVSDGLPRCLNQICDHSLMLAYLQDSAVVNEPIAREAFTDLQQLPLHWNDPLPAASPLDELRKSQTGSGSKPAQADSTLDAYEAGYEIDSDLEDQLNQLVENLEEDSVSVSEDSSWDSADLFSFGEGIEAIEIGSESEREEIPEAVPELQNQRETPAPVESESVEPEQIQAAVPPREIRETVTSPELNAGFTEIIDRYAAIDAGIDPATLPPEPRRKNNQTLQLRPPQFQSVSKPQQVDQEEFISTEESTAAALTEFAEIFDMDAAEIPDVPAFDFDNAELNHLSSDVLEELSREISGGDGSFEDLLAAQVYEVCAESRKGLFNALNDIRNYSETTSIEVSEEELEIYDAVQPEYEEPGYSEPESPAFSSEQFDLPSGNSVRIDSQTATHSRSSATAHLKGPALGRYKNLFSRLRSKQKTS
ncbi:ExeA family protein [Gimesia maris]|uniref:ExeA family protein n=1 Tax=Gimesia maris TaxID=122 RepID=UPI0030DADE78|tara:strand:+ start:143498 stop:145441 length:1944 start_codon:yes stop_codon:yes gene_type:complete